MKPIVPSLLLITDSPLQEPERMVRRIRLLAERFPKTLAIGLRDHESSAQHLYSVGREIRAVTTSLASLIVFDRTDVAVAIGADGLHLGYRSMLTHDARSCVEHTVFLSRSCHTREDLIASNKEDFSFVTLSPLYPSPNKGPALGLSSFEQLSSHSVRPVYALGGIDTHNGEEALRHGAKGLALIRPWFKASEEEALCKVEQLLSILAKHQR